MADNKNKTVVVPTGYETFTSKQIKTSNNGNVKKPQPPVKPKP